jgi:oligopeptide transport system ATP-binding protein
MSLLEVNHLKKHFINHHGFLKRHTTTTSAVDGISFKIGKGETLGLVGESGCGKSTTGKAILRLFDVTEGEIIFNGVDISKVKQSELKPYRRKMQMIFQNPYASLNSRMTVGEIIGEPLDVHKIASGEARMEIIWSMLERVGLSKEHANRYPHEFSGGQRQRIGIARAIVMQPELVICDEPISALDVSIQAQIINMLQKLQKVYGLAYLFITHDLAVVRHISDRVGVMYLGKIVEMTSTKKLFESPKHPYTRALISAIPIPDPEASKQAKRIVLKGDVPLSVDPPTGCRFRTRCYEAMAMCAHIEPELSEIAPDHFSACHLNIVEKAV